MGTGFWPSNSRPHQILTRFLNIIERLLLSLMKSHVYALGNFNSFQSAYRAGHSTETALLHVLLPIRCMYTAIDGKKDDSDHCAWYIRRIWHYKPLDTVQSPTLRFRHRRRGAWLHWIMLIKSANIALFVRHTMIQLYRKDRSSDPFFLHCMWWHYLSLYGIQHHRQAYTLMTHRCFFALKATTDIYLLESYPQVVKRWFLENDLMLYADKSKVML